MFRIALCDNDEQFLKKEYEIIQEYFSSSGEEYSVDSYCSGAELIKNTNKLSKGQSMYYKILVILLRAKQSTCIKRV